MCLTLLSTPFLRCSPSLLPFLGGGLKRGVVGISCLARGSKRRQTLSESAHFPTKSGLAKLVFRLSSFLSFLPSPRLPLSLSLCSEARGSWGIRWCVTTCQSGDSGAVPRQRGCVRVRVCVHVGVVVCVCACARVCVCETALPLMTGAWGD